MAEKLILKFSKLLFLTTLLILSSCGGSSDSSGSIPSIDNLSYSPQKAFLNDDGGSKTVNGTITFNDPDGDVSSYVLTVYDSNRNGPPILDSLISASPG